MTYKPAAQPFEQTVTLGPQDIPNIDQLNASLAKQCRQIYLEKRIRQTVDIAKKAMESHHMPSHQTTVPLMVVQTTCREAFKQGVLDAMGPRYQITENSTHFIITRRNKNEK